MCLPTLIFLLGMKFERKYFLHRLKNLQSLCSESTSDQQQLPSSLLFIPGTDGRHNKGSISILKYLFQGSIGKDISEGYLDDEYECLEEIVLLIQASSVSIFWRFVVIYFGFQTDLVFSREAKGVIGSLLCHYPYLIEYCPSKEEEDNVDLFQQRKCEATKTMILESVPKAGVVGVPIPLGYDDVMVVIESFHLLTLLLGNRKLAAAPGICPRFSHHSNWILYCSLCCG